MNLADNLKDLCIDRNLNIKQLAKLVKIQDSLLYKYVNENTLPTINNLVKLSNFFNCSINFLVGLTDNKNQNNYLATYDKKLFYPRYDKLLKENNLSHYELCKKLGLSMSSLRNWKNGGIPYLDTLIKLSQYFDVSIDYLIGRCD